MHVGFFADLNSWSVWRYCGLISSYCWVLFFESWAYGCLFRRVDAVEGIMGKQELCLPNNSQKGDPGENPNTNSVQKVSGEIDRVRG